MEILAAFDLVIEGHLANGLTDLQRYLQVLACFKAILARTGLGNIGRNQFFFHAGLPAQVVNINRVAGRDYHCKSVDCRGTAAFRANQAGTIDLSIIPTVAGILGKHNVYPMAAMPLIVGHEKICLRDLVTKIEPCAQCALAHIGDARNLATLGCSCRIPGISAHITGGSHQFQRANSIAALQVGSYEIRFNGIVVGRTGIGNHIDPVYGYRFQNLMYILIFKLTGIYIYDRILGHTVEIQADTNNLIITARANLNVLQIHFTIVPAIANSRQLKEYLVTDGPLLIDDIQRYPGIHIFKLEVSAELTASHIRQLCNSTIHLCGQTNKAVGHSFIVIEICLQRAGGIFTLNGFVVIFCIDALPAGILCHIFPTLLQTLIRKNVGVINFGILRCIYHIQTVYIEIIGIAVCCAVSFITNLYINSTRNKLAGCYRFRQTQFP